MAIYDLQAGIVEQTRLKLLLKLTKIDSKRLISALERVLVHGSPEETAAYMEDVQPKSVRRALSRLNEVNAIVEQIKEFDIYGR
jgi:hypothetical protein